MALEYKTRTQVVLEEIRNRILSGKIKAGEPLRQAALAEDLNVSRIPIREALLQLEAEGLVVFEPHRGATVTELSTTQVMELFELRALLETELLRLAIPKLTETALAKSEHILRQMTLAYQMVDTSGSWSELNTRFHLSLYLAAERPMMFEIVQNLNKNTDRYIRLHLLLAGGVIKSDPEHLTLLTLCRQKNVEQACIWLRQHILGAASEIIELVKQQ